MAVHNGCRGVITTAFDTKNGEGRGIDQRLAYLRLVYLQVTLARNRHNGTGDAQVPRLNNPTVLVTRPMDASRRFVEALRTEAGTFHPCISPAFENVTTSVVMPDFDSAIFTSAAGVSFAPDGGGRVAYCVGDATARKAAASGYDAESAGGTVQDLIALILRAQPQQTLAHIRGENSIGNVRMQLVANGIECCDVVAYRKSPLLPHSSVLELVEQSNNLIIPIFSAETVSIFSTWPINFSHGICVVISDAVADEAKALTPTNIIVSGSPNLPSMVEATARLIA